MPDTQISPQIISVSASAGSGKTYNLAKRYIELLFEKDTTIKNIIATTFARKAAIEMRYRVIEYLKNAALKADTKKVFENLNLSPQNLSDKSKKLLDDILNNYDDFNIGTTDSFKNRLLKACAINLGISPNFKIEKKNS